MLQIKDLTVIHMKDLRTLFESVSFVINRGDKTALIGEEGDGKSTLIKWIFDPELTEDYADIRGQRMISGERLAYLPQELPERYRDMSVYEFFVDDPGFLEMSQEHITDTARSIGISPDICYSDQKMGSLSGGEKVKVQLLRMVLAGPTMMLLDEPSNDLDLDTLSWLEDFINRSDCGVLYISHDETLLENTATCIMHIEQVRKKTVSRFTFKRCGFKEYIADRENRIDSQNRLAFAERREQAIKEEKLRRIQEKVEMDQRNVSRQDPHSGRLLKKKMHAVKSMERRFEREGEDMASYYDTEDPMLIFFSDDRHSLPAGKRVADIRIDNLTVPGTGRVLSRNISLSVKGPEKICIIGNNGAGKSTLIKAIFEELKRRSDIRTEYMPQDYGEALPGDLTPLDYLAKTGTREEVTRIMTLLGSLKFTADEMGHRIGDLSGGQRAKLLLLKLSLSDADVLILDEPTRNFSPLSGPVIRRMIKGFNGAVISISHDRKYISEVPDRVLVLDKEGLHET